MKLNKVTITNKIFKVFTKNEVPIKSFDLLLNLNRIIPQEYVIDNELTELDIIKFEIRNIFMTIHSTEISKYYEYSNYEEIMKYYDEHTIVPDYWFMCISRAISYMCHNQDYYKDISILCIFPHSINIYSIDMKDYSIRYVKQFDGNIDDIYNHNDYYIDFNLLSEYNTLFTLPIFHLYKYAVDLYNKIWTNDNIPVLSEMKNFLYDEWNEYHNDIFRYESIHFKMDIIKKNIHWINGVLFGYFQFDFDILRTIVWESLENEFDVEIDVEKEYQSYINNSPGNYISFKIPISQNHDGSYIFYDYNLPILFHADTDISFFKISNTYLKIGEKIYIEYNGIYYEKQVKKIIDDQIIWENPFMITMIDKNDLPAKYNDDVQNVMAQGIVKYILLFGSRIINNSDNFLRMVYNNIINAFRFVDKVKNDHYQMNDRIYMHDLQLYIDKNKYNDSIILPIIKSEDLRIDYYLKEELKKYQSLETFVSDFKKNEHTMNLYFDNDISALVKQIIPYNDKINCYRIFDNTTGNFCYICLKHDSDIEQYSELLSEMNNNHQFTLSKECECDSSYIIVPRNYIRFNDIMLYQNYHNIDEQFLGNRSFYELLAIDDNTDLF